MSDRKFQNLFKFYTTELTSTPQPLKNLKAISAFSQCRTPALGCSFFRCASGHEPISQFHSCRHRCCAVCSDKHRFDWIERQKNRLFCVPHFHVIFTLPHEYLSLWRFNESLFAHILFTASQRTLMELMRDHKHHGVLPGFMSTLHTWGRSLTLHPHIHCLVTAGGANALGQWQDSGQFLLPIRVVKAVYRGKVQALLNEAFTNGLLVLPPRVTPSSFFNLQRMTYQKEWSVRIEQRYEHAKGVALYLSRYVKGGPVHPSQVQPIQNGEVRFRYLDHRDRRIKHQQLTTLSFLRRVLTHVAPIGLHTVRYYGLYAPAQKALVPPSIKTIENGAIKQQAAILARKDMILFCKTCGTRATLWQRLWPNPKAFSLYKKKSDFRRVQQDVQADIAAQVNQRLSRFDSG